MPVTLPRSAPFPQEQIDALNRVIAGSTAEQRAWLSGYLAGLQAIPPQFYEAATIDGASAFGRFRRITIPLLAPTTTFIVIYNSILAFQVFDQVFVLTGGGPANSTNVVVLDLYRQAFERYNFGYAAAEAMVLFLFIMGITVLQYVYSQRYEVAY